MAKASFVKNVNIEDSSAPVTGSPLSPSAPVTTGSGSSNVPGSSVLIDPSAPVTDISTGSTGNTAPPDVSGNSGSNTDLVNDQDVRTAVRLDPNFLIKGDSVRSGRIRTQQEDQMNLFARQKTELAASRITSTTRAQSSDDITRHKQKTQARCNHLFDLSSGRCSWCDKKKSSQVYDP